MASNQYILVSELPPGWTKEQRLAIHGGVKALGPQHTSHPLAAGQPANVTHSRVSADELGMIFCSMFEDDEITRANIVATLAVELGLPEAAVDAKIEYGIFPNRQAVLDLLRDNAEAWGEEVA